MFARTLFAANSAFAREEDAAALTEAHIERLREPGSFLSVAKDSIGAELARRLEADEIAALPLLSGTVTRQDERDPTAPANG